MDDLVEFDISTMLEMVTSGGVISPTIIDCGDIWELDGVLPDVGLVSGDVNLAGIVNMGSMVEVDFLTHESMTDGASLQPTIINSGNMRDISPVALIKYPGDTLAELSLQEIQTRLTLKNKVMDLV